VKRIAWGTVALFALGATGALAVRQEPVPEYDSKSAFLYNFCVYTEWPASAFTKADSPIVIGIVGKDPFGDTLKRIVGDRTAQKRAIEIVRFEAVKDIKDCHLLFLPATEKKNIADALAKLKGTSTVLVGESDGVAAKGAIFNILIEDKKPKLEVNTDAAARAGVKLNSRLVNLAKLVKDE